MSDPVFDKLFDLRDIIAGAKPLSAAAPAPAQTLPMETAERDTSESAEDKKDVKVTKLVVIEKVTPEPSRVATSDSQVRTYLLRGLGWYGPDIPVTTATTLLDTALRVQLADATKPYNDYHGGWVDAEKTAILERDYYDEFNIAHDMTCNYNDRVSKQVADVIFLHYTTGPDTGIANVNSLAGGGATSHFVTMHNGRIVQLFELGRRVFTEGYFHRDARNWADIEGSIVARRRRSYKSAAVPGEFGYSIENSSNDGSLETSQLEVLPYLIRYIRDEVEDSTGHTIPFGRLWRGYPDKPALENGGLYYKDVHGYLLAHNEAGQTACPGTEFPWFEILQNLGVYPKAADESEEAAKAHQKELTKLKDEAEKFYEELDKLTEVKKKEWEDFIAVSPQFANWNAAMKDIFLAGRCGQDPLPPMYSNPNYEEDEVVYLVWPRSLADIVAEYDVTAARKDFIENNTDNGKKKYKAGEYIVVGEGE